MNQKSNLRKEIKDTLRKIPKPLYEHYSWKIATQLFEESSWKNANVIGLTISNPPEVDTYQIIRKAWEQKKQIVIPKCHPKERTMTFRTLTRFSQLESVYSGLLEPIEEETAAVVPEQIDLLIVPGLAFNKNGFRLGVGGGYYDRYLVHFTGATVSLAFTSQILDHVPVESHDRPVSNIITDEGIIKPG
ncbi:5-formyltetrahydrofolate cyclo-ligase [Neobacillus sp. PS3-34]|uniref:5-formyltetrahydrofolate cyclo-ligase n=1 Tax=Neobacillus sp. PS3-34 TaxID=3070678 RepID=UPI0027DFCCF7|nr:5-formyltetrahydrofolate cyclo-ligase [Neobacillus sp. PS3-34]WML47514.1 5-formyltetrahydrofolate cyclo-ligase [Neobacillus sp. PS3-34]